VSRVIWKEPLAGFRRPDAEHNYALTSLELPTSAEIMHVAEQGAQFCVWFSVPKENDAVPRETFTFALVPTGGDIPISVRKPRHLGSILQDQGALVWHIFLL